ncbi:dihydropteroate synthase [Maricurvus nonylphenolicus]|uniref:dihydropteroate synthase n=1 Tax=Maricurvus nonylphenolicus TaxID=1008307 RepID=UPI0036F2AF5D
MNLQCGKQQLDLSSPKVMGILNATPDSFSDGGQHFESGQFVLDSALKKAEAMIEAGADIIDVGGESTRPGALPVTLQQELDRVVPVVEAIKANFDVVVSVDTSSPEVMMAGADVGAGLINDVRALQKDGALAAAAQTGLPVCLMHMLGQPGTMQQNPQYENIVVDIKGFLQRRIEAAVSAGIERDQIIIDPGYGFGKLLRHNLQLLHHQRELLALGCPILAGLSRKSMIDHLLGRSVDERLPGSLALAMLAVQQGASIIRVHDVRETQDVLSMMAAVDAAV